MSTHHDCSGHIAVGDEGNARSGFTDLADQLLVARSVQDSNRDITAQARKKTKEKRA